MEGNVLFLKLCLCFNELVKGEAWTHSPPTKNSTSTKRNLLIHLEKHLHLEEQPSWSWYPLAPEKWSRKDSQLLINTANSHLNCGTALDNNIHSLALVIIVLLLLLNCGPCGPHYINNCTIVVTELWTMWPSLHGGETFQLTLLALYLTCYNVAVYCVYLTTCC